MNLSLLNISVAGIVLLSILGALIVGVVVYFCFVPLKSYFTAIVSGTYITSFKLLSLKNRKLDVKTIVDAFVMAKKAKIKVKLNQIENIYTAGGDAQEVVKALIFAKNSNVNITIELATAIELSSHNVYNLVQESVLSRVEKIEEISGVTQDNYEILASVNVSLKTKLDNYLTGTGLEELRGVIGAWIMENISKQADHRSVLKEPNQSLLSNIDLRVIAQKSMYEVIDINVFEVKIGRDLNMEREIKAAEKEKIYAEIQAERLKNAEEIKEIKMRAQTEEMKSAVLQAEAEVPLALSEAIKEGRFSVMDYYKLMNLQADTALRRAFVTDGKKEEDDEGDDF